MMTVPIRPDKAQGATMLSFLRKLAILLKIFAAGTGLMAAGGWVYAALQPGEAAYFWHGVGAVLTAITLFQLSIAAVIDAAGSGPDR